MLIELIGCTGAGKSTLLQAMLEACRAEGIAAADGEDLLLRRAGVGWVRSPLVRSLLLDLLTLPSALLAWKAHRAFLRLVSGITSGLPHTVPWWQRLNIGRNVLKKIGLYEAVRRAAPADQWVILDEGTVHSAHYLFVHTSVEPSQDSLVAFASLVPLPDALVLVHEEQEVLVSRTISRGHRRVPANSPELAQLFLRRAVGMFEALARMPMLQDRMFQVNAGETTSGPELGPDHSNRVSLPGILRDAVGIVRDARPQIMTSARPDENMVIPHDAGTD